MKTVPGHPSKDERADAQMRCAMAGHAPSGTFYLTDPPQTYCWRCGQRLMRTEGVWVAPRLQSEQQRD